jgi:hypothetical protein
MNMVTLADNERKTDLVAVVTYAEDTCSAMKMQLVVWEQQGSHLVTSDIDRVDFSGNGPHEVHKLIRINALINQALAKSPHIVSAQVQILENELYVICTTPCLVHLVEVS